MGFAKTRYGPSVQSRTGPFSVRDGASCEAEAELISDPRRSDQEPMHDVFSTNLGTYETSGTGVRMLVIEAKTGLQ